jgi:hypothetical protein
MLRFSFFMRLACWTLGVLPLIGCAAIVNEHQRSDGSTAEREIVLGLNGSAVKQVPLLSDVLTRGQSGNGAYVDEQGRTVVEASPPPAFRPGDTVCINPLNENMSCSGQPYLAPPQTPSSPTSGVYYNNADRGAYQIVCQAGYRSTQLGGADSLIVCATNGQAGGQRHASPALLVAGTRYEPKCGAGAAVGLLRQQALAAGDYRNAATCKTL